MTDIIIPIETLREILLNVTNIDTIMNMYNVRRYLRSFLDNSKFLHQLMVNIYYSLKPLLNSNPRSFITIEHIEEYDSKTHTESLTMTEINNNVLDDKV